MFTGIIEDVGTVSAVEHLASGSRLSISSGLVADDLPIGASVSVNGVCLTAVSVDGSVFSIDAIRETLARTNLGSLDVGSNVNLERAMPASGRFDGHVVQGHVDGTGEIVAISEDGNGQRWKIVTASGVVRYIVEKGSITVNGVSLTVAAVDPGGFEVALIPHTLDVTTFGTAAVGDVVNLEVDILAKYVERLMESHS